MGMTSDWLLRLMDEVAAHAQVRPVVYMSLKRYHDLMRASTLADLFPEPPRRLRKVVMRRQVQRRRAERARYR